MESIESRMQSLFDNFFTSLGKFIIEAFSSNLTIENKRERDLLLLGMIRNHFGQKIGSELLTEFHNSAASQDRRDTGSDNYVLSDKDVSSKQMGRTNRTSRSSNSKIPLSQPKGHKQQGQALKRNAK
jgi:hypothetical protein